MKIYCSFFVALVLLPMGVFAQALSDRVPADALIYAGWRGSEAPGPGYDASHLKAIVQSSQILALLNESIPKLLANISQQNPDAGQNISDALAIIGPLWKHPTAFYFGGVDFPAGAEPVARIALLCDAGADSPALADQFNALIAKGGPDAQTHLSAKVIDHLVVVSTYDFALPDKPLSQVKDFTDAMGKIAKDPVAAIYVDGAATVAAIDAAIDKSGNEDARTKWSHIRDVTGVTGLKKIAWASEFDGKGWRNELFIDAPAPRTGVMAMIDSPPVSDDTLKLIPAAAPMATAQYLDLQALFTGVHDAFNQFNPDGVAQFDQNVQTLNRNLGIDVQKDLLGGFGPQWATFVDPDDAGPGGLGMVVVNRVRNTDTLQNALGKVEGIANMLLGQALRQNKMTLEFKRKAINGIDVHYLASPLISPAWTIKDGTWYLALYPQVLVSAVTNAGGKSILDNQTFTTLKQHVQAPDQVSAFTYYDLPQLAPQSYQTLLALSRLYMGFGDMFGLDSPPLVLPRLSKVMPELEPAGEFTWSDDAGFHMKGYSPFPGSEAFGAVSNFGGAGVGEAALATSILLPSMSRAREMANRAKCASNERQIGQGIVLYSNDTKGKFPKSLGELYKSEDLTVQVFLCPDSKTSVPANWDKMSKDEQADWIDQHSDYVYVGSNLTAQDDPGKLVLYEKETNHPEGMNMLFVDGHVEFTAMEGARQYITNGGLKAGQPAPGL